MYDICSAVLAINPSAQVSVYGESDIQAKQAELKEDYDSKKYQRDRAEVYPSWQNQLDKIYHDGVTKWKSEMIDPIKDAHPKP